MVSAWLALVACSTGPAAGDAAGDEPNVPDRPSSALYDLDGDGFAVPEDCNDGDAAVHPGAVEQWYDGVDQDCSGGSDHDQDGDGSNHPEDCNDTDAAVFPDAIEVWYDDVDQDCSGGSDFDADRDGSDVPADCLDTNPAVYPGAAEVWYDGIDGDCLGDSDFDQDGDGDDSNAHGGADCDDLDPTVSGLDIDADGVSACAGDCAPADGAVAPSLADLECDGVDQDCSGGDHVCGAVYAGSLSDFDWAEPDAMDVFIGLFAVSDIGMEVIEVDAVAESLTLAIAVGTLTGDSFVPSCFGAVVGPPSDYTHAPAFQAGPTPFQIEFAGLNVDIEDFVLRGTIADDASAVEDVRLTGSLDTRPLVGVVGDVCGLVAAFGDTCVACDDGVVACIAADASMDRLPVAPDSDIDDTCGL